jgi:hypothetical protein
MRIVANKPNTDQRVIMQPSCRMKSLIDKWQHLRYATNVPILNSNEGDMGMCRSIKPLFNFEPTVNEDEIRAAALQYVRKISGFNKPSKANEAAFLAAVEAISAVSRTLLASLETTTPPKNRAEEAAKAKLRSAQRFGR